MEIRFAGGTVVGQPNQSGDPRDAQDGSDPRDEDLPENVCGPDVTAAYVEALKRAFDRLQRLSDAEKGAYDGPMFMDRNGTNIDLVADDIDLEDGGERCPRGLCKQYGDIRNASVTLAGHCVPGHVSNDILFGFEAYMLDIPWAVAVLGAQYAETSSYGWHFEPPTSIASYSIGWGLAKSMSGGTPMTEAELQSQLESTKVAQPRRLGGVLAYYADSHTLLEWVAQIEPYVLDCAPCPEPCESGFQKDGTKADWTLSDGSKVSYP
ncbi:MAG TPA: hypothetical protein VFH69_10025 [Gemmatimonadota bacterium]|nr:hypothetical protein [Gemmatimonadota bacterium]